jgi:hypothetical protein
MKPPIPPLTAVHAPSIDLDPLVTVAPGKGCRSVELTLPVNTPLCEPWAKAKPEVASTRARTRNRFRRILFTP